MKSMMIEKQKKKKNFWKSKIHISVENSQKFKNRTCIWDPAIPLLRISKGNKNSNSKRYMHLIFMAAPLL